MSCMMADCGCLIDTDYVETYEINEYANFELVTYIYCESCYIEYCEENGIEEE